MDSAGIEPAVSALRRRRLTIRLQAHVKISDEKKLIRVVVKIMPSTYTKLSKLLFLSLR